MRFPPESVAAAAPALIDLIISGTEAAIDVKEMCGLPAFVKNGRPMNLHKGYRLLKRPVRGVSLESAIVAGQVVTTAEAVARYLQKLNDPGRSAQPAPVPASPRRRSTAADRAHRSAMAELQRAGLTFG